MTWCSGHSLWTRRNWRSVISDCILYVHDFINYCTMERVLSTCTYCMCCNNHLWYFATCMGLYNIAYYIMPKRENTALTLLLLSPCWMLCQAPRGCFMRLCVLMQKVLIYHPSYHCYSRVDLFCTAAPKNVNPPVQQVHFWSCSCFGLYCIYTTLSPKTNSRFLWNKS